MAEQTPEEQAKSKACPLKMLAIAQTAPIGALPKAVLGRETMFQCLGEHCAWWYPRLGRCSIYAIASAEDAQVPC